MENYLQELAARVLRISRTTMDIGTGRRLRELAADIRGQAETADSHDRHGNLAAGAGHRR